MQYRDYSTNNDTQAHVTQNTDGTGTGTVVTPRIGITALKT